MSHGTRTFRAALRQYGLTVDTSNRSTTSASLVASGLEIALPRAVRAASSLIRGRCCGVVGGSTALIISLAIYRGGVSLIPSGTAEHQAIRIPSSSDLIPFCIEFEDTADLSGTTPTYQLYWKVSTGTGYLGRRGADTTYDAPNMILAEEYEQ